jgi:hypothetical protein
VKSKKEVLDAAEKQKSKIVANKIRVARWFVFKPKIPIRVNFGGP